MATDERRNQKTWALNIFIWLRESENSFKRTSLLYSQALCLPYIRMIEYKGLSILSKYKGRHIETYHLTWVMFLLKY